MSTAMVLNIPAARNRLARLRLDKVELQARHRWLMRHAGKWATSTTDGAEYLTPLEHRVHEALARRPRFGPAPSLAKIRKDVAEARRLIRKRNTVKSWLRDLGADPAQFASAEEALFWLFDLDAKSTKRI
jgi:hypothetical protein